MSIWRRSIPLALLVSFHVAAPAAAQVITQPASGTRLKAGNDFATSVFGDPWDMANVEDVAQFPVTNNFQPGYGLTASGTWAGTTLNDAYVFLLHAGQPGPVLHVTRFGVNTPIPAGNYTRLTLKFRSSVPNELLAVHWFKDLSFTDVGVQEVLPSTTSGWQTRSVVLQSNPKWFGDVLGFRVDPNQRGTVGMAFEVDWVRLTSQDVSTPVRWSGGATGTTVEAVDASGVVVATIGSGASGNVTWFYDGLPPGSYSIRMRNGTTTQASTAITINDPPRIALTSPDMTGGADWATVVKGNPWDMSDGGDVLGAYNVFGARTTTVSGRTVYQATSSPGALTGDPYLFLVNGSLPGIDAGLYHRLSFRMRVTHAGEKDWATTRVFWGRDPVNSSLLSATWDIMVWNNEFRTYALDLASLGSGSGIVAGGAGGTWTGLIRQLRFDPLEYPDATLFEIDEVKLAADAETENDGTYTIRWTATDADSADSPTVRLYYDTDLNTTSGLLPIASGLAASAGSYSWNASAVAPGLYYIYAVVSDGRNETGSYATGPLRVKAPIVAPPPVNYTLATAVNGAGSVTRSPAGVSCGANCGTYAAGTVVTLLPVPQPGNVFAGFSGHSDCLDGQVTMQSSMSCTASFMTTIAAGLVQPGIADMNGDGGGDVLRYNAATGAWAISFANRSGGFAERTGTWLPGERLYPADFDGDGVMDVFRFNGATGQWWKCFNDGLGSFDCVAGSWDPGWQVLTGDYNGDGRADVFVYNAATGVWVTCLTTGGDGSLFTYVVGRWDPAWQVHPVDFDGNGRTDLFLYNDRTGLWFRAMSNGAGNFTYVPGVWEIRGWQVHTGDFNADGSGDLFIYNRANGNYFVCINTGSGFTYRTGSWSAGWTVETGDMNGDGRTDVFVYEPASGLWFQCFYNNGFTYVGGRWDPGWQPHATELNGDGYGDVLLYNPATGLYFQCLSLAGGGFAYGGGTWGPGWTIVAKGPRW